MDQLKEAYLSSELGNLPNTERFTDESLNLFFRQVEITSSGQEKIFVRILHQVKDPIGWSSDLIFYGKKSIIIFLIRNFFFFVRYSLEDAIDFHFKKNEDEKTKAIIENYHFVRNEIRESVESNIHSNEYNSELEGQGLTRYIVHWFIYLPEEIKPVKNLCSLIENTSWQESKKVLVRQLLVSFRSLPTLSHSSHWNLILNLYSSCYQEILNLICDLNSKNNLFQNNLMNYFNFLIDPYRLKTRFELAN